MLFGKRIEHCPFIPFVIPHPKAVDYHHISEILQFEDQKPHLIFLANSTFEEPPYTKSVNIHVLYFRGYKEPQSTYYDFLDLAFDIIANYPNNKMPYIGVASRSSSDFCEFFIARWLFNECGYNMNESLSLVRQSLPPGITKKKFLHQLSRLDFKIDSKEPQETENYSISEETHETAPTETDQAKIDRQEIVTATDSSHYDQQNPQISEKRDTETSPTKTQERQPSQPPQTSEISPQTDAYSLQQQQLQRQQQQQLLKKLQEQAQPYYNYQNQIKQRIQEFQSHSFEYRRQNVNYLSQLQTHLQEAVKILQPIEQKIQQIQSEQQIQSQPNIPTISAAAASSVAANVPLEDDVKPNSEDIVATADVSASGSSASMQSLLQSQTQQIEQIEQNVPSQHVTMYFNEIKKMMNVPNKKRLFTKFAPLTLSQLEQIRSKLINDPRRNQPDSALTYCLMPEPEGIRAILYLRRKVPILIFQKYSPIQLKIDVSTNDEDLYIFEVILVRYAQSNIVLCDVMFANDEDVSSRPFNYRIGIVKNCYEKIFKQLNSAVIKFTIRPFYKLKDFRLLTDLFSNNPHKHFTKYPLVGISATLINSGNCHVFPCMFLWTKKIIENPRVLIEIDFGSKVVLGYAQCGTTSAVIAYLGKLTPEMFDLNGKVVEIEVLEQDPTRNGILNAKIIGPSDGFPWTTKKFLKYYPEREPHLEIEELDSMLEALASI